MNSGFKLKSRNIVTKQLSTGDGLYMLIRRNVVGSAAGILFLAAAMVAQLLLHLFNPCIRRTAAGRQDQEKKAENETLKMFEPKLAEGTHMAILQQQLEIQKRIVTEDKDADQFIKLLHDTAATRALRYGGIPAMSGEQQRVLQ